MVDGSGEFDAEGAGHWRWLSPHDGNTEDLTQVPTRVQEGEGVTGILNFQGVTP